jgi:raffinose synthase
MEEAVTAAAALSGGGRPRSVKHLPPSLDVFGWCTWDAFYSRVSARGLPSPLKDKYKEMNINWIGIDTIM